MRRETARRRETNTMQVICLWVETGLRRWPVGLSAVIYVVWAKWAWLCWTLPLCAWYWESETAAASQANETDTRDWSSKPWRNRHAYKIKWRTRWQQLELEVCALIDVDREVENLKRNEWCAATNIGYSRTRNRRTSNRGSPAGLAGNALVESYHKCVHAYLVVSYSVIKRFESWIELLKYSRPRQYISTRTNVLT